MEQGLLSIGSLLAILRGRIWTLIGTAALSIAAAAALSLAQPLKYTATATLIIDFEEPVGDEMNTPLAPALQPNYMATQLGIISSRHVAAKAVDRLGLASNPGVQAAFTDATGGKGSLRDWIAGGLLSSLQAIQGSNSRLVNISYTAGDPDLAARTANAFAEAYQETNLELSTQPAHREAAHFEQALREQRDKVERAQQQLSAFQAEKGILLVDERLDLEVTRLKELGTERITAESATQAAESKLKHINELRARGESIGALPEVLANDVVRQLKGQLAVKQTEFADISRQLGKNHPRYQQVAAELEAIQVNIAREMAAIAVSIKNELAQAKARVAGLQEAEAAQKAKVLELRQSRDALPALVRELESAQASYDQGLARANQYLVQSGISQTNVTLLNPALVPRTPSSPDIVRNLLLSAVLGLLLGIGMVFLRELIDRRLRTQEELQGLSSAAFLGALPAHKG